MEGLKNKIDRLNNLKKTLYHDFPFGIWQKKSLKHETRMMIFDIEDLEKEIIDKSIDIIQTFITENFPENFSGDIYYQTVYELKGRKK